MVSGFACTVSTDTLLTAVLLLAFNVQLNLPTCTAIRINQIFLCDIARLQRKRRCNEFSRCLAVPTFHLFPADYLQRGSGGTGMFQCSPRCRWDKKETSSLPSQTFFLNLNLPSSFWLSKKTVIQSCSFLSLEAARRKRGVPHKIEKRVTSVFQAAIEGIQFKNPQRGSKC